MNSKRRSRSRASRYVPSCVLQCATESLEERTLLTGNVLASVTAAGNLLIRGDSQANQVGLQTIAGNLIVSSLDGTTTINGGSGPFTASGVTEGVFIFLGAGDDVLKIGDTALTTIPHDLLVDTGPGNDNVDIENTSIGGNAWIFGSGDNDTISVGSPSTVAPVTVGGDLFIDGGSKDSTLAVFDANITGNLCLIGNSANDHIQVGFDAGLGIIGVSEDTTGNVSVGGNLTIRDGGDSEGWWWGGFGDPFSHLDRSMNTIAAIGGSDRALSNLQNLANGLSCGDSSGDSLWDSGGGDGGNEWGGIWDRGSGDSSDGGGWGSWWGGFGSDSGCGGTGDDSSGGEHIAVVSVTVGGNLTIKSHGGNDEVLIGAAHTPANDTNPMVTNLVFGDVTVSGNLKVRTGAGNDTLAMIGVSVVGDTNLDTGRGNDHIAVIESTGAFKGSFTLNSGAGDDDVVLSDSDAFLGPVNLILGRGNDTLWLANDLFQQAVTIDGGPGNDTFLQSQSTFPNSFPAGSPTLISIENNMPNVTPTDPVVVAAFSWFSTLLGV